jgi:pimeloyl-ACP methyl ester carboxylesterase
MVTSTLRKRDNLSADQLNQLSLPILILHGTSDIVYSVPLMQEWSALLTSATVLEKFVIEGGQHFLNASNPETDAMVGAFLKSVGEGAGAKL